MNKNKPLNDYSTKIAEYINELTGTAYLSLRDIPDIINKYSNGGNKALDFGCGAGRSTRFLKNIGLSVDGVDINPDMLNTAKVNDPDGSYSIISSPQEICKLDNFDIIFNLFVLFEFGERDNIVRYLSSFREILNTGGIVITIVNSNYLFCKNWLSCAVNFEQNNHLKSGSLAKIQLPYQGNIELYDYFWSELDYISFFGEAGFSSIKIHKPLGNSDDPYSWKDELKYPPYNIYIARK